MTAEPNGPDCGPELLAGYLGAMPGYHWLEDTEPTPQKATAQQALDATYAAIIRAVDTVPHPTLDGGDELSALAALVGALAHEARIAAADNPGHERTRDQQ